MNPDDMTDEQLMRLITLGFAVVWTSGRQFSVPQTMRIAERMANYIETGETP